MRQHTTGATKAASLDANNSLSNETLADSHPTSERIGYATVLLLSVDLCLLSDGSVRDRPGGCVTDDADDGPSALSKAGTIAEEHVRGSYPADRVKSVNRQRTRSEKVSCECR